MSLVTKLEQMKASVDSLMKWQRSGSMTMVNRDAHYQALSAVKDHVLKYVAGIVEGMEIDVVKHVPVAGHEIAIRKVMPDMYSGMIRKGTMIVHEFDRITIPQLAGQMQSLLELYDPDKLTEDKVAPHDLIIEKLKPIAEQAENGMVSQLLAIMAKQPVIETPIDPSKEIQEIILEANFITEEAKRAMASVDPRAEVQELKQRVEEMLARVESLVGKNAPTSQANDKFHDSMHQFQQQHDKLADRAQQELRILDDRIKDLEGKVGETSGKKTITITVT